VAKQRYLAPNDHGVAGGQVAFSYCRSRCPLDSLPGGMFGSAGVAHTRSWVYQKRLTGRLWNTASCFTAAPLTHSRWDSAERVFGLACWQAESGASLEIQRGFAGALSIVKLIGTAQQVALAKQLVEKCVSREPELKEGEVCETLELGGAVGLVIGAAGAAVKQLQEETGAKVRHPAGSQRHPASS
jgi:hypothetical protein